MSDAFATIDIPMVDDTSYMSTSGIFSNFGNNLFLKNEYDTYELYLPKQKNRRSPPFASEDELSESELSELEMRVSRGDFAATPNDFSNKKSVARTLTDSMSSTKSYDIENNKNQKNCNFTDLTKNCIQLLENDQNGAQLSFNDNSKINNCYFNHELEHNFVDNDNALLNNSLNVDLKSQKIIKKNNQQSVRQTNRLWLPGTVNESTSMPCLTCTQRHDLNLFDHNIYLDDCLSNIKEKNEKNEYDQIESNIVDGNYDLNSLKMTRSFTTVCIFYQYNFFDYTYKWVLPS